MTKKKNISTTLLMILLLVACRPEESRGCDQPPKESFSNSDLVGTWDAMDSLNDSTIIISGDGRYKQTMYVKRTGFRYESDWRPWRMTYSEKGLPYLHLEGFLMCAYWYQIDCNTGKTELEPGGPATDIYGNTTRWYDVCQKKWVDTPGEGVLMVVSRSSTLAPRGIELDPLTKSDTPTGPPFLLRRQLPSTGMPEPLSTSIAESTPPPRPTPNVNHCLDVAPGIEAQDGTLTPSEWTVTREPEIALAAPDGSCIKFGEKKYVKHAIGTHIVRGGTQGGMYIIWAPNPMSLVMLGYRWMALVTGKTDMAYLYRQSDILYPENSTIPVLQDLGNDTYIALVTLYEEILP